MKKLVTLLVIVLISVSSFAQDLTDQFYFRFGYSSPSWSQYGMDKDDSEGIRKIGATFELGSIFMLKSILNDDNMSFGINADYLYVTYGNFSQEWHTVTEYDVNQGSFRIGSKVGPSYTYSPMDKMAFDVYVKADIAWGTVSAMYVDKPGDVDNYYSGYGTVGLSTGVNYRYGLLILGFEYNSINPKLESDDYPGEYLGNASDDGDKTPMPCMNFTIGMSF